jgi:hypothetical protein
VVVVVIVDVVVIVVLEVLFTIGVVMTVACEQYHR